jgi:FixJ family two-component response regulator
VRLIHDVGFPIRDESGRLNRVGGIAQDLTRHDLALVYLVDPDESSRQTATLLLGAAGYDVKSFPSAAVFLEIAPALVPGCVVVNIGQSGSGGLTIPRELKARRTRLPVILARQWNGNVGLAVQAMKSGAADYLELPYNQQALLSAVASALADVRTATERDAEAEMARRQIARLSARERQVLDGLLAGGTNKTIAKLLGISPRTVELHRARLMERLEADTLPEAVLAAAAAGVRPVHRTNGTSS